jgi:uncharacterized protein involved in outer membrane biogenesis
LTALHLKRVGIAAGVLLLVIVLVLACALTALQFGIGERALLRVAATRAHRTVEVGGDLRVIVWSTRPRIEASNVTIGNPPWMPAGRLARLDSMTLTFAPTLWHPLRLHGIAIAGGALSLQRLASGAANWAGSAPKRPARATGGGLPALRALSLEGLRLRVQDEPRKLDFDGMLATSGRKDGRAQFDARGSLNGRAVQVRVLGDPFAQVEPDVPWHFEFDERSSGSRLVARGSLPQPFRFARVDARFTATGEDLRDLYYLTGVRLPDTGIYQLAGRFVRAGLRFEFRELQLTSGESDISGSIVSDSTRVPRRMDAQLHSKVARLRDVGKGAAGRAEPGSGHRLFAEWLIPLTGLRLRDSRIRYRADRVEAARFRFSNVAMVVKVEGGVLTAEPLTAATTHGEATGRVTFDTRVSPPHATAHFDAKGLELGELVPGKGSTPPATAALDAALQLEGVGGSFHALFASSNGTLQVRVPGGEMRAALAQLLGLDMRALGLTLEKEGDRVALRCGVLDATAVAGKMQIDRLIIDTEPVVLAGEGSIDLDSEALDVTLHGRNKKLGLRLRGPLHLAGTLRDPAPRLDSGAMAAQGAAAVVLGALLTPLAAAAVLVDPGSGKDADCGALAISTPAPATAQ